MSNIHRSSQSSQPLLRWALIGIVVLLVAVVLGGCTGPTAKPLTGKQVRDLGNEMAAIEQVKDTVQLDAQDADWHAQYRRSKNNDTKSHAALLRGYIAEQRQAVSNQPAVERDYTQAAARYREATSAGGIYATEARYRIGILGAHDLLDTNSRQTAKNELQNLVRLPATVKVWVRQPELVGDGGPAVIGKPSGNQGAVLYSDEASTAAVVRLDSVYKNGHDRDATYYRIVDVFVRWFKAISPTYGAALALIVLALIIKLVTIPMTNASFRGMRDMQRVQPLLKELQEKYKDDRAKLAEEQMKLMKEHKVSPLGGCLPMLIQLPIFIVVYRAVQVYAAGFADS
ncbi:MAG TPA: YidC/Oxa1 family membrane protein insertase, partial [Armatimonadota bacterium]|nr:YidC/Oxa1 family membrane protein insertase [Armatimonadota bacterium]